MPDKDGEPLNVKRRRLQRQEALGIAIDKIVDLATKANFMSESEYALIKGQAIQEIMNCLPQ